MTVKPSIDPARLLTEQLDHASPDLLRELLQPTTGVMGDPRPATPEKGETLLATLAELVAGGIRDEELWRVPDDVWTPGRGLGNTNGASYEAK